jgi:Tol biopolymer transport system component
MERNMMLKTISRMLSGLVFLTALFGCVSTEPSLEPLPNGITLLAEIDPDYFYNPIWSPDGSKIAGGYVTHGMPDLAGINSGHSASEIFIFEVATGNIETILREEGGDFRVENWKSDSKSIIFNSYGSSFGSGCFSLNIDELIPEPAPYFYCGHRLSPDGKQYVSFEKWYPYRKVELVIRDTQFGRGNVMYSLSAEDVEYEQRSDPQWSPDGGKLVFGLGIKTEKNEPADSDIYIIDIETRSVEKFVSDPVNNDYSPVYSPNGNFIAHYVLWFTEDSKLHREVVVTRVDMSCQWQLPIGGSFDWSPDSTKLVISADDGVYIVDLPEYLGESFVNGVGCP